MQSAARGNIAAQTESANGDDRCGDRGNRGGYAAGAVACDVVERGVGHDVVGDDVDDNVRENGRDGCRSDEQEHEETGQGAHHLAVRSRASGNPSSQALTQAAPYTVGP